jgi:hypothetical protein
MSESEVEDQLSRHVPCRRSVFRAGALVVVALVAVAAGGCAHGSHRGSTEGGLTAPSVPAAASAVPTASIAPSETTTPAGTPTATATVTAKAPSTPKPAQTTSAPAAPKVTHVALSVDNGSYQGVHCPHTFTFNGTISVSAGPVTVTYAWKASVTKKVFTGSVHFGPGGAQHATVHLPMGATGNLLDTSYRSWMNLSVTAPNAMAAPNANVFVDCVPPTEDLKVNVPAGPGACGGHVTTMSVLVVGSPNVAVPYTIEWGDGTHQTGTTTVVPPARSSVVDSHHTYASGKYTVHVWAGVSGDSGISGDSESFSITCS